MCFRHVHVFAVRRNKGFDIIIIVILMYCKSVLTCDVYFFLNNMSGHVKSVCMYSIISFVCPTHLLFAEMLKN